MTREQEITEKMLGISTSNFASAIDYGAYRAGYMDGADWADAHPQDRWISVEDELPKEEGRYMFYDEILGPQVSTYYEGCTLVSSITHWMLLPSPPRKEDEK